MTNTLHAHVSTSSVDCDGPIYRDYVETFNDEEVEEFYAAQVVGRNDFSDIHFMNRVFVNACGPYAVHQMRITADESGFEYQEDTEEGYRRGEVRWCRDNCDTGQKFYRDMYAEQMGY